MSFIRVDPVLRDVHPIFTPIIIDPNPKKVQHYFRTRRMLVKNIFLHFGQKIFFRLPRVPPCGQGVNFKGTEGEGGRKSTLTKHDERCFKHHAPVQ